MNTLPEALYDVMAASAPLTALLGSFKTVPSIFTVRPVPDEATRPVVLAEDVISDLPFDVINTTGRQVIYDIRIEGRAPENTAGVKAGAELIRNLFHRNTGFVVPGWKLVSVSAAGPVRAPTNSQQDIGRIVTLTLRLRPDA